MLQSVLLIDGKLSDRTAIVDALIDTDGTSFSLECTGLLSEGL